VLALLPVLIATVVGPAPPLALSLGGYDLATLTDAEASQLAGRRALYGVVIEGRPDWSAEDGWRYDCRGDGSGYRSLWLPDGDRPFRQGSSAYAHGGGRREHQPEGTTGTRVWVNVGDGLWATGPAGRLGDGGRWARVPAGRRS
jgi:hypothetical protein